MAARKRLNGEGAVSSPPFATGWSVRMTCLPICVSTFLPPGSVTIISLDMGPLLLWR